MTKILLVEDDKSIVTNLTEYLSKEGYEVRSASGQRAALQLAGSDRFDLVLLDIALSDGNGFAVCKAIKSDYHIPVIFLTASGDEYSTVTGFELGADDYIAKPFRPRELVKSKRSDTGREQCYKGGIVYNKVLQGHCLRRCPFRIR